MQGEFVLLVELKRNAPLHNAPAGNNAHGGNVLADAGRPALTGKPAHGQRPLGEGVYLAVHALEGRLQQHAAQKRCGVAHRRHGDVKARTRLGGYRHAGRHHHRGHVFGLERRRIHADTHAVHHVFHGTQGKNRILLVSRACQPHHKAVTDKLVVTHTRKRGYILDAHGLRGQDHAQQQGRRKYP